MVGPGSRLINAGGSSTIAEEEEQSRWINGSLDLPALDPFGLWFHCDKVKKAAREAVQGKFDQFAPSYYAVTPEQKESWWNRFKTQFKYQKFREPEIEAGFAEYISERLRDLVCRAGTRKNTWMEPSVFEELLKYRAAEAFKNRSAKSKKNRASKGKDGKAPGTHTMGRLNCIQYMDKLCNEKGGLKLPPPEELLKKSKTKKSGGYVCDEVSELLDKINTKKDALLETLPEEDVDDNEIYIETVNGFNKKGEVLGLGKATSFYFDKPLPSSKAGGSKKSYTPGFVSKLYSQNQTMKEELSEFRQWKVQLEQTLASQGIHLPTQSCNPNSQPHNDSHLNDNEGNGGNGSSPILGC